MRYAQLRRYDISNGLKTTKTLTMEKSGLQ